MHWLTLFFFLLLFLSSFLFSHNFLLKSKLGPLVINLVQQAEHVILGPVNAAIGLAGLFDPFDKLQIDDGTDQLDPELSLSETRCTKH